VRAQAAIDQQEPARRIGKGKDMPAMQSAAASAQSKILAGAVLLGTGSRVIIRRDRLQAWGQVGLENGWGPGGPAPLRIGDDVFRWTERPEYVGTSRREIGLEFSAMACPLCPGR